MLSPSTFGYLKQILAFFPLPRVQKINAFGLEIDQDGADVAVRARTRSCTHARPDPLYLLMGHQFEPPIVFRFSYR